MLKKLTPVAIALTLFYVTCSFAQPVKPYFKHLTRDQGLSSNRINCITQDKFGFMWFGTEDGISRYDGINFKIYRNRPGLVDNYILSITSDPGNGNLWIGTQKGITYFNRKEDKFYQYMLSLPKNDTTLISTPVNKTLIDSRKRLWICTNKGLYLYKNYKSKPIRYSAELKPYIAHSSIIDIFEDSNHNIWAGTRTQLCLFDSTKSTFKTFPLLSGTANTKAINEDNHHNLWISTTDKGVFVLKNKAVIHHFDLNNKLNTNHVSGIAEDENGKVWIAARDGGGLQSFNYNTNSISYISQHSKDPTSVNSNAITSIFKDSKGYIWIGTFAAGLNYYDRYRKQFAHYKAGFNQTDISNSNVRCLFQDPLGEIWIGTRDEGGVSKFNAVKGTFTNYTYDQRKRNGLNDGNIIAITGIGPNKLIIGTNKSGISIFDKQSSKFSPIKINPADDPSFSKRRVGLVAKDQKNTIWVASSAIVYNFNSVNSEFKTQLKLPNIQGMLEYNKEEIYFISMRFGLYHYNRKTGIVTNYRNNALDSTSLSSNRVNSIIRDKKGNIWLATYEGVNLFNPKTKKFKAFTSRDGFPNDIICGVLMDAHDNLWASTVNGIAKFNPKTKKIRVYDVYDGLQGNEFEKGVCLKTLSGEMLFGGINGFNYFHPDSIKDNPVVPSVIITDFKIFNKSVPINAENSPLTEDISLTKKITLTHKQTVIDFEFTGLNFTSPEKNQYAYKLEGLEKEWNYVGNKSNATYSNLPEGSYVFQVKASNNDGVWNTENAFIKIIILPPWWKTWWFNSFLLLAFIASGIGFYYYRTRNLRKQTQKLELLVKKRTFQIELQNKELEEHRDQVLGLNTKIKNINENRLQFFTNISHEFRTPLSLILGPINSLISGKSSTGETEEHLHLIKRNADRLLFLINELMDFRSLENRNTPLHIRKVDFIQFTQDITSLFTDLARQRDIVYKVINNESSINGWCDTVKLQKIIFNLISNAFKYIENEGSIEIETSVWKSKGYVKNKNEIFIGKPIADCKYFEMSVKDTGVGIAPENLTKIFKEFYREPSSEMDATGTGLGLALIKELVKLHKGLISVQSEKGIGSIFKLKIPFEKHCFENCLIDNNSEYKLDYSKDQIGNLLGTANASSTLPVRNKTDKNAHILVVDDNLELLSFITQQLSSNYRITQAINGVQALKLAGKHTPDLIISDVVMPKMTGIELCKNLKTDIKTSHIPVILLTARADVESQIEGLETGADDYIPKPFDLEVVKIRIHNLIQSRNKLRQLFSASEETSLKDVSMNPLDETFLQKAMDIVKENISNSDFGVRELVDKMCVSPSLLQKKIARLTSYSPIEFITVMRLKKALQLIKQPELSITDISAMVGFIDPYYFSRCFKKHFGKSPKLYAETVKQADIH